MYSDTGGGGANFVIVKSGKPNDACCTVLREPKRMTVRDTGARNARSPASRSILYKRWTQDSTLSLGSPAHERLMLLHAHEDEAMFMTSAEGVHKDDSESRSGREARD